MFLNSAVFYLGNMHKGSQHALDQNVVSVYRPHRNEFLVPIKYWENEKLVTSNENVHVYLSYKYENEIRNTGQIYTACLSLFVLISLGLLFYRMK